MKLPDLKKPFSITTDASRFAIGAVLSQMNEEEIEVPVAFFSRKMKGSISVGKDGQEKPLGELAYPVHEQELMAIVDSLAKWRHYLMGNSFKVYTDHHPLIHFMQQKRLSPRQARWAEFLQQFQLEINYTPGKTNLVADALSRRTDYEEEALRPVQEISAVSVAISDIDDDIKEAIQDGYDWDKKTQIIWNELDDDEERKVGGVIWVKSNGYLNRRAEKGRQTEMKIYVPDAAVEQVVNRAHGGAFGACQGIQKTTEYIKRSFVWDGLYDDIAKVINKCARCAQNKSSTVPLKGMLQPLEVPEGRWQSVSMDFIVELPTTLNGDNAIFVIVDRFTKMAHFLPMKTSATAGEVARIFVKEIWRLHGLPKVIVSDRDPKFVSGFWKELMIILNRRRAMSTAYHPESDGQTERTNRTLEQILRYYCSHQQGQWDEYLDRAEFCYNNSRHASIGTTPFFANYGYHPRGDFPQREESHNEAAGDLAKRMEAIEGQIRQAIGVAQQRQALYANKRRREREFDVGDWVFLSTANLKLQVLSKKLAPKYVGPLEIIEKLSSTAYRLDLPETWRIHNVFYVGLLKENRGSPPEKRPRLPALVQDQEEFEVEEIQRHRKTNDGLRFLVKWKGYSEEESTWQRYDDLTNAPKKLAAYCKAADILKEVRDEVRPTKSRHQKKRTSDD